MIVKFEKPTCGCCPLSAHGYGSRKANERAITLIPGVNVLTTAQYDEVKDRKVFKHRVETGTYRVDTKITGDSISGLDESDAKSLVGETLDRNILRKWLVEEQRKPVREAIDIQLERVKPEVKPQKTGSGAGNAGGA